MRRKKTPLNRKRLLTEPAFERSRENSAEFSRACTANRLLRRAFVFGLRNTADRYISGRLTQTMVKVLQSDPMNDRGERRVPQGVLSILEGFNFNRDTSLQNVLKAPYSIIFDEAPMLATIQFTSFISRAMIHTASGAHSFRFIAMAASVDFEQEAFPVQPVQTDILDMSLLLHKDLQLQLPVIDHQPGYSIIIALGVEFFYEIQGAIEPVDKKHNTLAVVKVI